MNINYYQWGKKFEHVMNRRYIGGYQLAFKNFISPLSKFFSTTRNASNDIIDLDLYAILNVTPNASQKQIKAAYYRQSLLLHPDRHPQKPESLSNEKFTQLAEAYKILGDAATRKNYDLRRRIKSGPSTEKSSADSAVFHEDVLQRHHHKNIPTSGKYDQWTRSHYKQSLTTRDDRIKRDILRREATHEDRQNQSSRVLTVFGIMCLTFGMILYHGGSSPKRKS